MNISEIAKGLRSKERACVLEAKVSSTDGDMTLYPNQSQIKALSDKKLMRQQPCSLNYLLTPVGLKVREYLEGEL